MPHQPKVARNSGARTLCSAPKRCNSNDAISMFEIHVGELRATFLRNHNMRCHKDPSRRQPKQKTPATPTAATSTGALHPIWGAVPVTWRCTRYGALHPLRGAAPEQKRCIAYGSGAAPQQTRTNAELAHRNTRRRTPPCAPGPYWRQHGHAAHAATCTPAHSGPIRPNPTSPTPLHAKNPITYPHTTTHKCDRWRRLNAATRRPARPRIRRSTSLRPAALSLMNLRSTN